MRGPSLSLSTGRGQHRPMEIRKDGEGRAEKMKEGRRSLKTLKREDYTIQGCKLRGVTTCVAPRPCVYDP